MASLANCPCCGRLIAVDPKGRVTAHPVEPQIGERQNCRGTGHKAEQNAVVQLLGGSLSIALAVLAQIGVYR